ncbi:MAG: type II secretion system minor pseudopilin GspK [Xanthomonadales bacterium]|nr:type II secretion system minor pseudopilin GspK [Xanthomonadales bacterium]
MRRGRGIALLVAVLAVAIASLVLAALVAGGEDLRARQRHLLRLEQGWQLALGLERWAELMMRRERQAGGDYDAWDRPWLQPLPPLPVPGGTVSGGLADASGCLNLNALVPGETPDPVVRARLERLLDLLGLPRTIAAQAIDWIDPDLLPEPGGAEDPAYLAMRPPRRAANRPFLALGELIHLPDVDEAALERLRPHVCALPDPSAPINVNFASPELLMALDPAIDRATAEALHADGRAAFASEQAVLEALAARGVALASLPGVAVRSRYLLARATVRIDDVPMVFTALLEHRDARLEPVWRRAGPP